MAAYGCMRALSTVLDSVSSMPALFPHLEAILFPVMQRLVSTDGQDVFEEVLEIVSYFTYFSPEVRGEGGTHSQYEGFPDAVERVLAAGEGSPTCAASVWSHI